MPFCAHRATAEHRQMKRQTKGFGRLLNAIILLAFYTVATTAAPRESTDGETVTPHDLIVGEKVFTTTCLSCHGKGEYGAPKPGNASDWKERLKQDQDTLVRHAIDGHGRMPPKGGYSNLSDAEVEAAVAYVVNRSRKIITALNEKKGKSRCHAIDNPKACSGKDMEDVMTLHMLWLLMGGPAD